MPTATATPTTQHAALNARGWGARFIHRSDAVLTEIIDNRTGRIVLTVPGADESEALTAAMARLAPTGQMPTDAELAAENHRLKAERDALRAEIAVMRTPAPTHTAPAPTTRRTRQ